MNDFIEKVKSVVSKTAKDAVKVSNDAVEYTKLKFKIGETNDKIYRLYADLGKSVYISTVGGDADEVNLEDVCAQITELNSQLEQLESELSSIANKAVCPDCGAKINTQSTYCPKCGAKV